VALLDGSFYSPSEIPGRDIEDIPHPLIPHTMDLLQQAVRDGNRVVFTHLNNTNAALDEGSAAATRVAQRGFEVAQAGMRFGL
ncbi:MAG: pyrroloquinoline quinone biosynthesis protein PqqB, partial [Gemmatimonadetes bacterium]|nr:pyrroloquinoline quinone biosynthesis protein PqqB [Gemmatimonadota bacterium]